MFEAQTPGWSYHGDREDIRQHFHRFSERFEGARPTGRWAEWFSIISWPITHAVLPTDLQRHLARMLSEYRTGLTVDLLHDPAEFGARLAARSWQTSSRFQSFAENTHLLGQVAAALLTGDDEESPFLLDSTLKRIVADLSKERDSGRWLREAKVTASQVRAQGLAKVGGGPKTERERDSGRERLPAPTDPNLWLRSESSGWTAYLAFPDLTALAERLPAVHEEVGRLRAKVAGVSGPPLARGRVLAPGQWIRLDEWPGRDVPLITLENGSPETNSLLAGLLTLPPGPPWLFKVRDDGAAAAVRRLSIRPGGSYVLLAQDDLSVRPEWMETIPLNTDGVRGYSVRTPDALSAEDLETLRNIGLSAITAIMVRPVGFVSAAWDGEGAAEWNAGEQPLIGVSSTHPVNQCIFTLDGSASIVRWPADGDELFIRLEELDVGAHTLEVSFVTPDEERPLAEGTLHVAIRTPPQRRSTGSLREGLVLLPAPISPTLTELWDAKATVEIQGPEGVHVKLHVSLGDRSGAAVAQHGLGVSLPVDRQRWLALLGQIREAGAIQRSYEESETCLVEVSHPELGSVALRCEREFTPLRWVFRRDGEGPFIRLIDNTDGAETQIEYRAFDTPDRAEVVEVLNGKDGRWPRGGLVTAVSGTGQASVILPASVRRWDELRDAQVVPKLRPGVKTTRGVSHFIRLADQWSAASLPADPLAAYGRTVVLRAIAAHIAGLIGGDRWEGLEHRLFEGRRPPSRSELQEAVGSQRYQRELALDLSRRIERLQGLRADRRAAPLAFALEMHARAAGVRSQEARFSEFLLRLASDPASLLAWPEPERDEAIERTLTSPLLLRAARYLVLAIDELSDATVGATYAGWEWE